MNDEPFYQFRAQAQAEDPPVVAELLIYSPIGAFDDMGETAAQTFARDLAKLPTSVKRLDIHINSPGGSVSEAQAIYSRLADHRSEKVIYVDGLAASAASLIAMVGHKVYIRSNANMMIHAPRAIAIGTAEEMDHTAGTLRTIGESMINVYAKKTGLPRDEIRDLMNAETWFTAEDAVEKGFADEVRSVVKATASADGPFSAGPGKVIFDGVTHDVSAYHNVPAFPPVKKPTKKATMTTAATASAAPVDQPEPPPEPPKPAKPQPQPQPPPAPPEPKPPANEFERGVAAERKRVTALAKFLHPLTTEIVAEAIQDGSSVEDIVAQCWEVMDENAGQQAARMADAQALNAVRATNAPTGSKGSIHGVKREEFGAMLKAKAQARAGRFNGMRKATTN
jgi:ATP-dependent protease ClpP protease subunit